MNQITHADQPTWETVIGLKDQLIRVSKNASGARSIQHVFEACEVLAKGGNSISIAAVGRFCVTTYGGPKAQSISNNGQLVELVQTASKVDALRTGARRKARPSWEEDILSRVPDPHVRSQVQIALIERRSLIGEVSALKDNFKRLKAVEDLSPVLANGDLATLEQLAEAVRLTTPLPPEAHFTDEEKRACRDFLSRGIAAEGWFIDEASGEIQTKATRRPIARSGLTSALGKITKFPVK